MIKAFAHELIFGWLGVLEANLLRCAHCCIEMEIAARHVFRLRKTWRGNVGGIDRFCLMVHDLLHKRFKRAGSLPRLFFVLNLAEALWITLKSPCLRPSLG